jgi:hypothetical protein
LPILEQAQGVGDKEDTMTALPARRSHAGVNRKALWASATLLGVGGLLCAAGVAVSIATVVGAARRWASRLDEPLSHMARRRRTQAQAATSAAVDAWRREGHPATVSSTGR